MEKYAVEDNVLIDGLRDEEHQLMLKVASHMSRGEKNAADESEYNRAEARLQQIRGKITEHDLRKKK